MSIKNIKYFLIIAIALSATSCKKYLETTPVNAVSDLEPIKDKISAETALRGVYRQLASANYYGENYVTLGYFPAATLRT